jgi:hypothetical protein
MGKTVLALPRVVVLVLVPRQFVGQCSNLFSEVSPLLAFALRVFSAAHRREVRPTPRLN